MMSYKINYYFNLVKFRFKGLRNELKYLLFLSLFSIIFTETIFNKYYPIFQIQYDFGIIFIKLCYSYLSAFIFYYLVVYAPKERKRVKAFRYTNNKIHFIYNSATGMLINIFRASKPETNTIEDNIGYSEILDFCSKVNPYSPVPYGVVNLADDYHQYIESKSIEIKNAVNELLLLNDLLDDELFLSFANINDILNNNLSVDKKFFKRENLSYLAH